jgi:hypothetical protein
MEFTMFDRDGEVIHVFERGDSSKTFYNFVSKKVFEKYLFELSPSENWERGVAEWNDLTPELQAHLMILTKKEEECAEDLRIGLLATLAEYQGLKNIKELFADAIKGVQVP